MNNKIVVLIINYNGAKDTIECVDSIKKNKYPNGDYKIIVADDCSTDNSREEIKKTHPGIDLIKAPQNYGTAGVEDFALRYCLGKKFRWIFLLNNDTLVEPNFLDVLNRALNDYPGYALYASQIRIAKNKNIIWYNGGRILFFLGMVWMFGRNSRARENQSLKPREVNFTPMGYLIDMEKVKKVGFKKKEFFIYWDDAEWQARLARIGLKFLYVPEAIIYHKVSQSSGGATNPKIQYYHYRNGLLFAKYNLRWYHWLSFLTIMIARLFILEIPLALLNLLKLDSSRFKSLKYMFLGIYDFARGKFGKCNV